MTDDTETWLTVEEARAIVRLSARQFYRYAGQLRTRTQGRRTLYAASDVEALAVQLDAASRPPPAPQPPRVEVMQQQQSELLDYIRERDAQLAGYQRDLVQLAAELAAVRAEVAMQRQLTDQQALHANQQLEQADKQNAQLQEELTKIAAERDALRAQLDQVTTSRSSWWRRLLGNQ